MSVGCNPSPEFWLIFSKPTLVVSLECSSPLALVARGLHIVFRKVRHFFVKKLEKIVCFWVSGTSQILSSEKQAEISFVKRARLAEGWPKL